MVTEFFSNQVSGSVFLHAAYLMRHSGSQSFDVDPNRLTQYFLNAYDATYGAYQRNRQEK